MHPLIKKGSWGTHTHARAQYCCTLTTGIFITTAANAAEETKGDTPYWRTLKNNGELNKKYPGGLERQRRLLKKEGHTIINKGKRLFVKDFEKKVIARSHAVE